MLLFLVSCDNPEEQDFKAECKKLGRGISYCEMPNGDVCYIYYERAISCKFNNQDNVK